MTLSDVSGLAHRKPLTDRRSRNTPAQSVAQQLRHRRGAGRDVPQSRRPPIEQTTRSKSKTIVFMSRTLLEPPIQALDIPHVADGIAYMQGLMHWIRDEGETVEMKSDGHRVTVYRRRPDTHRIQQQPRPVLDSG